MVYGCWGCEAHGTNSNTADSREGTESAAQSETLEFTANAVFSIRSGR
jgi:hypothetical protein